MIKAVIFDAGGVLHPSSSSQRDELKRELNLDDEQLTKFYETYLPQLITGELTETEVWKQAKEVFNIRRVSKEEKLFTRAFHADLKKNEEVYEIVEDLKVKGIKVMLLTNVSEIYAEILEQEGHYEPFVHRILSYKVGLAKPDPNIYKLALQQLNINPDEAVFIDDKEINVKAAKELSMHGIQFENPDQLKKALDALL